MLILYPQSLCHFLHHELSEYHRLLAVLESQMSNAASTPDADPNAGPEDSGLTLLRLGLWTEEMRLKMKMMVDIVDDAKGESHGRGLIEKGNAHDCSKLWWCASIQDLRTYQSRRPHRPDLHGTSPRRGKQVLL